MPLPEGVNRPTGPVGRGYVLVIDDDPDIAAVIVEVLDDEGYDTETASNGEAALEAIHRRGPERPSLILLDYNMPVCDGPAFAAAYRERPGPHAPLVCLTAAHSAATRCAEMGAEAFLGKPFGLDDLLALVERYAAA